MRLPCLLLLLAWPATQIAAQGTCTPPEDSNEAKLLAFFSAPIAFSPGGNVTPLGAGKFRLGFELTYVPQPSDEITQSEFCQDKSEETDLSPIFPRPRLAIGLGRGFVLEGSYLPPVTVMDATPNLGSVALSYLTNVGATGLLLRAHATFGQVEGAITCPEDAIQTDDVLQPCYATEPSEDTYKPNMFGVEAAFTFAGGPSWSGYGGAGFTAERPRFQVGFQDARPGRPYDDTKIEVDLNRIALFLGAVFQVSSNIGLSAELYSVPEDVTTFRVGASYTWK